MNNQSLYNTSENKNFGFKNITIRTMSSDIEELKKEGGAPVRIYKWGKPLNFGGTRKEIETPVKNQYQFTGQASSNPFAIKQQSPKIKENENKKAVDENISKENFQSFFQKFNIPIKIFLGLFLVIIFFSIGYFVLPKIVPQKVSQNIEPTPLAPTTTQAKPTQTPAAEITPPPQPPSQPIYTSLFKIKPDNFFEIKTNLSAPDFYKYYKFLITDALSNTTSGQKFFEAVLKNENDEFISPEKFLEALNIKSLPGNFWNQNFENIFTIFIYKNKTEIYPGYIFQLKNNVPPILLQNELKQIESNKDEIKNFFIKSVDFGENTFKSGQIFNREPIRLIKSQNGTTFVYGIFFNKYLIISTSQEGLEEAIKRM